MDAQQLAIEACKQSKVFLVPGISEKQFAKICEEIMQSLGAEDFWYPMLVNFNNNSIHCTRGAHLPSQEVFLKDNDIVLVDFSPKVEGLWGDYSETILVGDDAFFKELISEAKNIFELTYDRSKQCKTVGELFDFCNDLIIQTEFNLLDPNGNIGHTIENYDNHNGRIYIAPENKDVELKGRTWAIEPHIGTDRYGAKFENVIRL